MSSLEGKSTRLPISRHSRNSSFPWSTPLHHIKTRSFWSKGWTAVRRRVSKCHSSSLQRKVSRHLRCQLVCHALSQSLRWTSFVLCLILRILCSSTAQKNKRTMVPNSSPWILSSSLSIAICLTCMESLFETISDSRMWPQLGLTNNRCFWRRIKVSRILGSRSNHQSWAFTRINLY